MLPIANKPMLLYGFDQLRASGISQIGVILGPLQEGVVDALGDGSKFGARVTYRPQPHPEGMLMLYSSPGGFLLSLHS
jgi:glucose-1-phosphate thymidylyltransferase